MKILGLMVIAMAIISCNNNSTTKPETINSFPITTLSQKDTLITIDYVADLQAAKNVEIRPRTTGLLSSIHVQEGQMVKKGQILFTINNSELKIELEKAIARYNSTIADAEVARVEVDRVQLLVDNDVVTGTELSLAKAKHKALVAASKVALAEKQAVEKQLSYASITAPFDGFIDRLPIKEGSLVNETSLLTTITDISTIKAYFHVSENEYYQLIQSSSKQDGIETIRLVLPDGSEYPHIGTLTNAESEIDESGNIAFKVIFDNPQRILRHGTSGKILISRTIHNAILIPQKSVLEIQDKNFVYVFNADSSVQLKSIRVGERLADAYILIDGVQSGDRILVEGIQNIKDGEKIIPKS